MVAAYPRIKHWISLYLDLEKATPAEVEAFLEKTRISKQPRYKNILNWLKEEVLRANIEAAKREKTPKVIWNEGSYSWRIEAWRNGWIVYTERNAGHFARWEKL
jgi:hypothetical protein